MWFVQLDSESQGKAFYPSRSALSVLSHSVKHTSRVGGRTGKCKGRDDVTLSSRLRPRWRNDSSRKRAGRNASEFPPPPSVRDPHRRINGFIKTFYRGKNSGMIGDLRCLKLAYEKKKEGKVLNGKT